MSFRLSLPKKAGLFLVTLAVTVGAVFVASRQVGLPLTGIDDAHIFLVYGKNLASGEGFVYNPGGERVEGFSSLLWLLIITVGFLALPSPEQYLLVVSILLVCGAISVLALRIERPKALGIASLVLIAWVFSSPAYVTWLTLSLMDTALWGALLVLGAAFALYDPPGGLAVVASLMVLARPEGMLWAPVLIAIAALPAWVEKGPRTALCVVRPAVLAYLVTLSAITIWRLWYFGYPLPNTYYVKMSPDTMYNLGHGLTYLLAFLDANPVVLVGVIPAIVALLMNGRWFVSALVRPGSIQADDPRLHYVSISLILLLALLVPVYMGGDHFGNFRFYQPAWPLLILPAFALLKVLKVPEGRALPAKRLLGYSTALLLIMAALLLPKANWFNRAYRYSLIHELAVASQGQMAARFMNELFAGRPPSVGVVRAGAVAAIYDGQTIDLMGLNNTAMAHAPGDRKGIKNHAAFNAEVFFAQRPEIMLPMVVQGADPQELQEKLEWDNAVLKGLLDDPRFTAAYELVTISNGQAGILAYASREFIPQLVGQEIEVAKFVAQTPMAGSS